MKINLDRYYDIRKEIFLCLIPIFILIIIGSSFVELCFSISFPHLELCLGLCIIVHAALVLLDFKLRHMVLFKRDMAGAAYYILALILSIVL